MRGTDDARARQTRNEVAERRRRLSFYDALGAQQAGMLGEQRMDSTSPAAFRGAAKFGRYTILEHLGAGGMGEVWAAYDPHLDRKIALKLIHPQFDGTRQEKYRARLLREAQALAKLSHPNVVSVYDVDRIDDRLYIAMEFVEGETVADWVARTSPPWHEILGVYRAAAQGLAAAHRRGIVHRDIKPSNILVGTDRRVCVLDFGLAKAVDETDDETSTVAMDDETSLHDVVLSARQSLTKTGPSIGTPGYMALEQIRGGRDVGPAVDQFALAVSLYESLYGVSPFARTSLLDQFAAMEAGEVTPPPRDTRVPSHVFEAMCRALQSTPDARYPSMDAFVDALDDAKPQASRRYVWMGVGLTVLAVGAGATWIAGTRSETPEPCQGAAEIWDSVWNDDRYARLEAAVLATNIDDPKGMFAKVFSAVERYGEAWKASWTNVCEATAVQGVQSQTLMEARMDCLTASRRKMVALLEAVEDVDATALDGRVTRLENADEPALCETLKPIASIEGQGDACKNGGRLWAASWSRVQADDVVAAFKATGIVLAEDAAQRVDQALQGYGDQWVSARTRICEATQLFGEQSEALLDVRMNCLDERRREVDALIRVFMEADEEVVVRAVGAAYELRSPTACEEAQPSSIDPKPEDPRRRREIEEVEELVRDVDATRKAGRYTEALLLGVQAVDRAEHLVYAPVLATALLKEGLVRSRRREYESAKKVLLRAVEVATEAHDARTEAIAWVELIYIVGALQRNVETADAWRLPAKTALIRAQEEGDVGELRYRKQLIEGASDFIAERFDAAEEAFREIIQLLESDSKYASIVSGAWANLGLVAKYTNRPELARDAMQQALTLDRARLGAEHPRVADLQENLASLLIELGDIEEAESVARNTWDTRLRVFGRDHQQTALSEYVVARILARDRARWDEAEPLFVEAISIFRKHEHLDVKLKYALEGLAGIADGRGDYNRSYDLYLESLTVLQKHEGNDFTDSDEADILNKMCAVAIKAHRVDEHPGCSKIPLDSPH